MDRRKFRKFRRGDLFQAAVGGLFLFHAVFAAAGDASEPDLHRPPVVITQGEQRLISLPGLKRYSLGSEILRALPAPGRAKDALLLKAVKPGITDLWIWKTDGTTEHRPIEVRAWKVGLTTDLERRLTDLREVEVWIVGDPGKAKASYLVHGAVTSDREAKTLGRLLESFPSEIEARVSLSEPLYHAGEKALRRWIEGSVRKDDLELEADPDAR
jgi:hypothetical protein